MCIESKTLHVIVIVIGHCIYRTACACKRQILRFADSDLSLILGCCGDSGCGVHQESVKYDSGSSERNMTHWALLYNKTGKAILLEDCHNGNPAHGWAPVRLAGAGSLPWK